MKVEDFKIKLNGYKDTSRARKWFEDNFYRIKALFENKAVNDFVFESFQDVFKTPPKTIDKDIYFVITQVAIINMVLAGLPGQMGVGIFVSMALEAWMAYVIAKHVGVEITKPVDVFKYFGAVAAVGLTIIVGFKHVLGFTFSLFSFVSPVMNPLIIAELIVTNFIGVLFWVGFVALKEEGDFKIPVKMGKEILSKTKTIFKQQYSLVKSVATPTNLKQTARRIKEWFTGDVAINQKQVNGELFASTAVIYMMSGQYEKFDGPLGQTFLEAIKLRWSAQFEADATIEEIAERFKEYSPEQMEGVVNTIKGKMFEIMVENTENNDDDSWSATMHTDELYAGSDIIFTNPATGEVLEVSLKAVSEESTQIIEHALSRYPDIPIMTTDEMAEIYADNPKVFGSGISHEELHSITKENAKQLIDSINSYSATEVVINGVVVGQTAALWPFVVAYMRNKIDFETLQNASVAILGEAGFQLASRLSWAVLFGPIYAWYLLARGVDKLVIAAEGLEKTKHQQVKTKLITVNY